MCNFCNKIIRFWQKAETVGGKKYHKGCAVMVDRTIAEIRNHHLSIAERYKDSFLKV